MAKTYLLLGGNLGDRLLMLNRAKEMIEKNMGNIIAQSAIYETSPWGFSHSNNFYNQLVIIETMKKPQELLENILEIELNLGRARSEDNKWKEREIDIDILFYNDKIINEDNLKIPHPYLHQRKFALVPLAELAADLVHPVFKKNVKRILAECKDNSEVKPLKVI